MIGYVLTYPAGMAGGVESYLRWGVRFQCRNESRSIAGGVVERRGQCTPEVAGLVERAIQNGMLPGAAFGVDVGGGADWHR